MASLNHVEPPCPHYNKCGGCTMQHLDMASYQSSKYESVRSFLEDNGVTPQRWDDPIFIPEGTRRRATFKGIKNGKSLTLGYSQSKSHDIFNLKSCDVLDANIVELQNHLTTALTRIIPHKGQISLFIQKCDNGMDVVLTGKIGNREDPDLLALETIADIVNSTNIIRLSWRPNDKTALQTMLEKQKPTMQFGELNVKIEPLAFLQPSTDGQNALAKTVLNYCPDDMVKVADLFCGYGTFTGALLSKTKKIDAFESDKNAINALKSADHKNAYARDLFRDPLLEKELNKYDTIIIDPPRAGAKTQVKELAKSDAKTIIHVSCNPNSFTRDARTLIAGGYRLERLTFVDQFIWTTHSEIVAKFIRD